MMQLVSSRIRRCRWAGFSAVAFVLGCVPPAPSVPVADDTARPTPSLAEVQIPPLGSTDNVKGRVVGLGLADFLRYGVTAHIRVEGRWWGKPFADSLLTPLRPDGTFEIDITTGGIDEQADAVHLCLVRASYLPLLHELPSQEDCLDVIHADRTAPRP